MRDPWMSPAFEEVSVCGECTAYAGVMADSAEAAPASQPVEPAVRGALEAQAAGGDGVGIRQ
jgi:hypothetical protein